MNTEALLQALAGATEGDRLYRSGFSLKAADVFQRSVEGASESTGLPQLVDKLRWTGNALIWGDRPEEAIPYLLRAISYEGQPGVPPVLTYAAMTDLCLASLRCRTFACFQRLMADTQQYLATRGLESWGHRLDRLASMAALRRGRPAEAYELATRSWQRHRATPGGPHYQEGAYLHTIFLAAHALGDVPAMDQALADFSRHPESYIQLSRVRHAICLGLRRAFDGVTAENAEAVEQHALEALNLMLGGEYAREEAYDVFRLLAMLGRTRDARPFLALEVQWDKIGRALLRLDIAICRLARPAGWQPPFYTPHLDQAAPPLPLLRNQARPHTVILRMLKEAETHAQAADARMECDLNQQAIALRKRWLLGEPTEMPDAEIQHQTG